MKHARLESMVRGWFVGAFTPTALHTDACEVAIRHYAPGDAEAAHHHRIATEITVIVTGEVEMLGRSWTAGDIVVIEPGEPTAFRALTQACCVVVKTPSAAHDKYTEA